MCPFFVFVCLHLIVYNIRHKPHRHCVHPTIKPNPHLTAASRSSPLHHSSVPTRSRRHALPLHLFVPVASFLSSTSSSTTTHSRVSSVRGWRAPSRGPRVSRNWTERAVSAKWSYPASAVPTKTGQWVREMTRSYGDVLDVFDLCCLWYI